MNDKIATLFDWALGWVVNEMKIESLTGKAKAGAIAQRLADAIKARRNYVEVENAQLRQELEEARAFPGEKKWMREVLKLKRQLRGVEKLLALYRGEVDVSRIELKEAHERIKFMHGESQKKPLLKTEWLGEDNIKLWVDGKEIGITSLEMADAWQDAIAYFWDDMRKSDKRIEELDRMIIALWDIQRDDDVNIRDEGLIKLADIDDPIVLPHLKWAQNREANSIMVMNIQGVIDQLVKTALQRKKDVS